MQKKKKKKSTSISAAGIKTTFRKKRLVETHPCCVETHSEDGCALVYTVCGRGRRRLTVLYMEYAVRTWKRACCLQDAAKRRRSHVNRTGTQLRAESPGASRQERPDLLDVVAVHEHDVVPVGPVDVQVDLTDVRRRSPGPGLQLLCTRTHRPLRNNSDSGAGAPGSEGGAQRSR